MTFEGPGQGGVIRKQNIPFRYDWEKVVSPVLDYIFSREKIVDPNRIALMGISMGGYLAARAAAFEDRIAACVLYNGVYDGYDAFASGFPQSLRVAVENGNENVVNTVIEILSDIDANMRFNIKTRYVDYRYQFSKVQKNTLSKLSEEHCQSGAPAISNQRIFDWLDETLQ